MFCQYKGGHNNDYGFYLRELIIFSIPWSI